MPVYNKPQFNSVWADSGEKLEPTSSKISTGWIVEIPPKEIQNWLQNRSDVFCAHINQVGIVQWDSTTEYQALKSYVQGTSGVVYRALQTHTNRNPDTDVNGFWSVAFESSGTALLKSQNLADVPDKPLARQNLGIASTSDYDARYLLKNSNLADVPNKASARGNIDVYSKQEVIDLISNAQPAGEIAAFGRNTAPLGWLPCDGSIVSRDTYARLFAAIGTRFGPGNGSTTFQLPDLRGEFIRGWDSGKGIDSGRVFGSSQSSQNLIHAHTGYTDRDGIHHHSTLARDNPSIQGRGVAEGGGNGDWMEPTTDAGEHMHGFTTNTSGGNESRPRNVALLYCIRT